MCSLFCQCNGLHNKDYRLGCTCTPPDGRGLTESKRQNIVRLSLWYFSLRFTVADNLNETKNVVLEGYFKILHFELTFMFWFVLQCLCIIEDFHASPIMIFSVIRLQFRQPFRDRVIFNFIRDFPLSLFSRGTWFAVSSGIAVTAVINIVEGGRREIAYQINPPSTHIWYSSNWIVLRWLRERGWLPSTLRTVSLARTTLTCPSASTSAPASAASSSSSLLFRRRIQGEQCMMKRRGVGGQF